MAIISILLYIKIHSREGAKQLLKFFRCFSGERGHWISPTIYRKPTFTGQYIRWNPFSPKQRKIKPIRTLVHRALMIYSKTKLGSELDKIKQLLIENGYPDVLFACLKEKLANFSSKQQFGPEKCPVYLR